MGCSRPEEAATYTGPWVHCTKASAASHSKKDVEMPILPTRQTDGLLLTRWMDGRTSKTWMDGWTNGKKDGYQQDPQ